MKMLKYCTLFILIIHIMKAQIVPSPKYDLERLNFGVKLKDLKAFASWKRYSNDKMDVLMAPQLKGAVSIMFIDSVFVPAALVRLLFSQSDSALFSVQLIIGESPEERSDLLRKSVTTIWVDLVSRFGSSFEERNIPMFGIVRKWLLDGRTITAVRSEKDVQTLIVTYTKK